jgi:hypothetical protein
LTTHFPTSFTCGDCLIVREADGAFGDMSFHVSRLRLMNFQVGRIVVEFVAIYVVNYLTGPKWSPQHLFCYESVDRLVSDFWIVNGVDRLVCSTTRHRAVLPTTFFGLSRLHLEREPAVCAGYVLRASTRHCMACLGTPLSLTWCTAGAADVFHLGNIDIRSNVGQLTMHF